MKNELDIRCIMSKDSLPVTGAEQAIYALVDIKAGSRTVLGALPANFGLVLDRSGSMDGAKMEHLKEAVGYVVDHMNADDLLSVTSSTTRWGRSSRASRRGTAAASRRRSPGSSRAAAPRSRTG